jgi:hypothetical protein
VLSKEQPGGTDVLMVFPAYPGGSLQGRIDQLVAADDSMPLRAVLDMFEGICVSVYVVNLTRPSIFQGCSH